MISVDRAFVGFTWKRILIERCLEDIPLENNIGLFGEMSHWNRTMVRLWHNLQVFSSRKLLINITGVGRRFVCVQEVFSWRPAFCLVSVIPHGGALATTTLRAAAASKVFHVGARISAQRGLGQHRFDEQLGTPQVVTCHPFDNICKAEKHGKPSKWTFLTGQTHFIVTRFQVLWRRYPSRCCQFVPEYRTDSLPKHLLFLRLELGNFFFVWTVAVFWRKKTRRRKAQLAWSNSCCTE